MFTLVGLLEPLHGLCVIKCYYAGKNIPFFGSKGFRFEEHNAGDLDGVVEAAGSV